jgi:hypothetical protein
VIPEATEKDLELFNHRKDINFKGKQGITQSSNVSQEHGLYSENTS